MARVPGTLDQRKIYAIRSFGLNEIIHFSNEQYDPLGKARRVGGGEQQEEIWFITETSQPCRNGNPTCISRHFP